MKITEGAASGIKSARFWPGRAMCLKRLFPMSLKLLLFTHPRLAVLPADMATTRIQAGIFPANPAAVLNPSQCLSLSGPGPCLNIKVNLSPAMPWQGLRSNKLAGNRQPQIGRACRRAAAGFWMRLLLRKACPVMSSFTGRIGWPMTSSPGKTRLG